MLCEREVCERVVCDKVVCDKVVYRGGGWKADGGGRERTAKNKNPTQRCGEWKRGVNWSENQVPQTLWLTTARFSALDHVSVNWHTSRRDAFPLR